MQRVANFMLLMVLAAALAAPGIWAQGMQFHPVPRDVRPQWAPVPDARGVQYAPNLATDLFRFANQFFYYSNNAWYQAPTLTGPWQTVRSLPPAFYQIQAPYFKNPPGWARGRKTGWRGAPLPPGQMKKFEGGPQIPPGQMKKY